MGELDLLEELIQLFKQNALEFIGKFKFYLPLGNIEELLFAAHKVKTGFSMMQTYSLFKIIEQMEVECKAEQDLKHLAFLFECFLNEYPGIESEIDKALGKLRGTN